MSYCQTEQDSNPVADVTQQSHKSIMLLSLNACGQNALSLEERHIAKGDDNQHRCAITTSNSPSSGGLLFILSQSFWYRCEQGHRVEKFFDQSQE